MGVYISGPYTDYSAMQGPAPEGFHIPSKDEWVALSGILTTTFSMASNATTIGTYLKMSMVGSRHYSTSSVNVQGTYGYYWSSTSYSADSAYNMYFNSSSLSLQNGYYRANGFSVRCFKDSPTVPDTSWTTLYDGSSIATGAGIYHNSSLGLISVSGDGQTWITIQDKNLGATQVRNSGDVLSEANCGGYFQWGNNYMFPFTGTITTSSTQVDASGYGPGNYYSSSTFILGNSDRSSVQNDNLWGGITGVVPAQNELKNAYIGIPYPESISLDKSSINLTTIGQTEQLTATIEPTVSDKTITWTSSDNTIATVSSSGLVTCVTPGECTITATTVNGLTATCSVVQQITDYRYLRWTITADRGANPGATQASEFEICDNNGTKMSRPAGTVIASNYAGSASREGIDKLIDGDVYTKYCTPYNPTIIITITLGTEVDFSVYNTYKWYTANDASERDPISWTIELSNDQSNWITVATVSNATITTSRYALAFTGTITL